MPWNSTACELPNSLLHELSSDEHVSVSHGSDLTIIDLRDSSHGDERFVAYLHSTDTDPILSPFFGIGTSKYVSENVEREVFDILFTFQSLTALDFQPGAVINLVPFVGPFIGFHFHHGQMSLITVQEELEDPQYVRAAVPGLSGLPSGHTICDLFMTYQNAQIIRRICRC